jgi:hypothetical protein
MCNLLSVRHTRARLPRIGNRTVYTRRTETDCQPVLQECSRRVSASRAKKSYAGERTGTLGKTVLADQRASEHSLRCKCASLGARDARHRKCARPAVVRRSEIRRPRSGVSGVGGALIALTPRGIIRSVSVNDLSAGGGEVLRVLDAVRSGQVSPCEWHPGVRPRSRDSTPRGEQWNRSRRMPCVCPPFWC